MKAVRIAWDAAAMARGVLVIGWALLNGQDPKPFMLQVRRERLVGMPAIARLSVLLKADRATRSSR